MSENHRKKTVTLVELLIATVILTILTGVTIGVFFTVIRGWSAYEAKAAADAIAHRGVNEAVLDLREARAITSLSSDEIRFTVFTNGSQSDSIYYLYNSGDAYPPSFNQDSYELRRAAVSGGIAGNFTYGSGVIIARNILPPPNSDLSLSGNLATIDLSISQNNEVIRSRTEVRPRNL